MPACESGVGCGLGRDLPSADAGGAAALVGPAAGAGANVGTPVVMDPDDGAGRTNPGAFEGGTILPVTAGRPLTPMDPGGADGDGRGGSGAALRVGAPPAAAPALGPNAPTVPADVGGLAIAPTLVRSGRDTG